MYIYNSPQNETTKAKKQPQPNKEVSIGYNCCVLAIIRKTSQVIGIT